MYPLQVVLLALVAVSSATCKTECPLWTTFNSTTGKCECGSDLGGVVTCNMMTCNKTIFEISLVRCYCMTYDEHTDTTEVGLCYVTCGKRNKYEYTNSYKFGDWKVLTNNSHELNQDVCGYYKRTGRLCAKCMENYSLPVYSYSPKCAKCLRSEFKVNLLKYIAVAFLPLTMFYIVVTVFKVSILTGDYVGYVLACQIITSQFTIGNIYELIYGHKLLLPFFEIWNLDFLRPLYSPFCIHPDMTTLQVLALDYLVAVYPLFLIFLTYTAVLLHDRYSIVVKIWRPAYRVLSCIRREWNIRGSLIQAFATFMVLSYVKILNVSFRLLIPVRVKNIYAEVINVTYLASDAELVHFGREHLPYGILAIVMLSVFNILPTLLLLVYPCGCFQKCLTCCGIRSVTLHTFMDTLQGCYRYQPRDCRYFAGYYLCVRILTLATFAVINDQMITSISSVYFSLLAILVTFVKPYRQELHNKIDVGIFSLSTITCLLLVSLHDAKYSKAYYLRRCIAILSLLFFALYGCCVMLSKVIPNKCVVFLKDRYQQVRSWCLRRQEIVDADVSGHLPYRFEQEQENTSSENSALLK